MSNVGVIRQNMFPAAQAALRPGFPWHRGAASPRSSQALAVSVFGTLACHPRRQALIGKTLRILFDWEVAGSDDWQVILDQPISGDLLGEPTPTQPDVLLIGSKGVVVLECKFTEVSSGACSQPRPLSHGAHKGVVQCNKSYGEQINPANGRSSRCALSGKGIRYWELIPHYFQIAADQNHDVCPFVGPAFQYMRSLLAAAELAGPSPQKVPAAFGLVYVDGPQFPIAREVADPHGTWPWFKNRLRSNQLVVVGEISYQTLVASWRQVLPDDTELAALDIWMQQRIAQVSLSRASIGVV